MRGGWVLGKAWRWGHKGLEEMEVGQGPRESCLLSGQDAGEGTFWERLRW